MKQKHDQEGAKSKKLKITPLNYKKGRSNDSTTTDNPSLSQNAELSSSLTNQKL